MPDNKLSKEGEEMKKFKKWWDEFSKRHPDFPLVISVIALVSSIAMPILRKFLA